MASKKSSTPQIKVANMRTPGVTVVNEAVPFKTAPLTEKERMARKKVAALAGGFGGHKTASFYGSGDVSMGTGGNWYSPQLSTDFLEKPQNLRERRAWYRHFYNSTEIIGAAIDLHSTIPLSKLKLQKPKAKNEHLAEYSYRFFEKMSDRLKMLRSLSEISHEFWLIGNCLDGESEVRSTTGYKPIKDVRPGDRVLTHKGTFEEVEATMSFPEKKLLKIKIAGKLDTLRPTLEHPVEVLRNGEFVFVDSSDITTSDYIKQVGIMNEEDVEEVNYLEGSPVALCDGGYTRTATIKIKRNEEAQRVRRSLLSYLCGLLEPTKATYADLSCMFECSISTLSNVVSTLNRDLDKEFHVRSGPGVFGGGSSVEWLPLPEECAKVVEKEDYVITRDRFYTAPHSLDIDEDFMYMLGYWLGDGTLGRDSSRPDSWGRGIWYTCFDVVESGPSMEKIVRILESKLGKNNVRIDKSGNMRYVHVKGNPAFIEWWSRNFGNTCKGSVPKKIPDWVKILPKKKIQCMLAGLLDSDGYLSTNPNSRKSSLHISSASPGLIRDIWESCVSKGIVAYEYGSSRVDKSKLPRMLLYGSLRFMGGVHILGKDSCEGVLQYTCKKFKETCVDYVSPDVKQHDGFLAYKVKGVSNTPGTHRVYNLQVANEHTFVVNGNSTHNCHTFAEDHNPYEGLGEDARASLEARGKAQSDMLLKEYKITDTDPNYIGWRKLIILPPDQVRVTKIPFADNPLIEYLPDAETKAAITRFQESGGDAYANLSRASRPDVPEEIRNQVSMGGTIPLEQDPNSGSFVYHFARKKSQYETNGVSILERCVNTLLVKDKLRQAQTSIASRHMTPIRVVTAEDLSEMDVEDLRSQIDMALMDPDYSIVANYAISWEEYGSNQRLLDLSAEFERYDSDLYAGLGVTKEMMTGESSYSGSKITLELLNIQYLLFRDMLQEYIEKYLFEPVARRKGFVETDKYGNERIIYPKISFARLSIRDNDSVFDQLMQLYNKGSVPIEDIYDLIGIDATTATSRIKNDLLTVNDAAFNDLVRGVYQAASSELPNRTNVLAKLAQSLGLTYTEPDEGPGAGDAGAAGGGGGLRFASDKSQRNELNTMINDNPESVALLLKFLKEKNKVNVKVQGLD